MEIKERKNAGRPSPRQMIPNVYFLLLLHLILEVQPGIDIYLGHNQVQTKCSEVDPDVQTVQNQSLKNQIFLSIKSSIISKNRVNL